MISYTTMLFYKILFALKCLLGLEDELRDQLLVAGEGEVMIDLCVPFAGLEVVGFTDDAEVTVPCNPGADDSIECCVHNGCHGAKLHVRWKVTGSRAAEWIVCY